MWSRIKNAVISANDLVKGNRRRIAMIASALTTIGGVTDNSPLFITGTALTALFGKLDYKDNKDEYKKLLGIKK